MSGGSRYRDIGALRGGVALHKDTNNKQDDDYNEETRCEFQCSERAGLPSGMLIHLLIEEVGEGNDNKVESQADTIENCNQR